MPSYTEEQKKEIIKRALEYADQSVKDAIKKRKRIEEENKETLSKLMEKYNDAIEKSKKSEEEHLKVMKKLKHF